MTFDMAHPRSLSTNGAQNGVESPAQPSGHQPRFSRPFTLQEALPYSPFTSVIPFESGMWLAEDSFNQMLESLINYRYHPDSEPWCWPIFLPSHRSRPST